MDETVSIYNTLTQKKEVLVPLVPGKLNIYVCGITVYDYCHIGHARVMVGFDIIVRYLKSIGFDVNYVRNITDIDDKIIERANKNQESIHNLTDRFIGLMHEDFEKLGCLPPTQEPRATAHMQDIINMIEILINKKSAYVADNKDVYFSVESYKNYGELSHRVLDDLRAGDRVEVVLVKRNPLDFVLWKSAKSGEPSWPSPWGEGRPGWHIECSAMSLKCLGETFDIHGGGFDLIFPHHENERAQSEACTHQKFVNTWMHIGFVQVNDEKMSKSLGNFFTIREVLAEFDAEVVRYLLLASHYRSPINYSYSQLQATQSSLERLYNALRGLDLGGDLDLNQENNNIINKNISDFNLNFNLAMSDDFNTPVALSVLFDLAKEINVVKATDILKANYLGKILKKLGNVLGILQRKPEDFLKSGVGDLDIVWIENLIAERKMARQNRDFKRSDEIRDELKAVGVVLEDASGETVWRKG